MQMIDTQTTLSFLGLSDSPEGKAELARFLGFYRIGFVPGGDPMTFMDGTFAGIAVDLYVKIDVERAARKRLRDFLQRGSQTQLLFPDMESIEEAMKENEARQ